MIEINLLPPELRPKRKGFELGKEFVILASIGAFAVLVGVYLLLAALAGFQDWSLKKWLKAKAEIEVPLKEVTQLKQKIRLLQDQAAKAQKLTERTILWSEKLNEISDLLQPGIWLIQLSLQKSSLEAPQLESWSQFVLMMKGRAYSRTKEETALVGHYISALKEAQDFFKDFKDIQLEKIQGESLNEVTVAEFNLICPMNLKKNQ